MAATTRFFNCSVRADITEPLTLHTVWLTARVIILNFHMMINSEEIQWTTGELNVKIETLSYFHVEVACWYPIQINNIWKGLVTSNHAREVQNEKFFMEEVSMNGPTTTACINLEFYSESW